MSKDHRAVLGLGPGVLSKRAIAEAADEAMVPTVVDGFLTELDWGLTETLLWIAIREPTAMARVLIPWRRHFSRFQAGSFASMVQTQLSEERDAGRIIVDDDPGASLRKLLRHGQIVATGLQGGCGARSPIPAEQWSDLGFHNGPSEFEGRQCAFDGRPRPELRHFWADVLFSRRQVQQEFPDLGPKRGSVAAEAAALASLMEQAQRYLADEGPIPVRAEWRERCGLGPNAQRRVWSKAAAAHPALSSRAKPKRNRNGITTR